MAPTNVLINVWVVILFCLVVGIIKRANYIVLTQITIKYGWAFVMASRIVDCHFLVIVLHVFVYYALPFVSFALYYDYYNYPCTVN